MSHPTQWQAESRSIKIRDFIVQQVHLPPFKHISQKIIFGVRIKEVIDQPHKKGFSYETLEGHVEKGFSIFTIEQTSPAKLIFKIHTFLKPATTLTKLLGPFFSVPYQNFCPKSALKNVKRKIETLENTQKTPSCS